MSAPVVLLHGFAASSATTWERPGWLALLEDAGRRPLAIDLLGHGDAPRPHDVGAYAEVEDRVASSLPSEPVDAIGFSAGARVLLALAAEDPSRFHRLVIAGVGANLFRQDDRGPLADMIRAPASPEDRTGEHFHRLARAPGNDPLALAAFMQRPEPPLDQSRLSLITRPALVVIGDRDFAGPADPLVEALPDATLEVLGGTDHFATPKDLRFIDLTLEFLTGQGTSG
jgi:pimeloyl-ACP methyl ester carboxylesterase